MKFACPNPECRNGVGFFDANCSKCGFELSFRNLRLHYLQQWGDSLRRRAVTKCPYPHCGAIIPISSKACPKCGQPLTVNAAFAPAYARLQSAAQQRDPKIMRRVQRIYFLLSCAALIGVLCFVERQPDENLQATAAMSVVYLVVIMILIRLFIRADKVLALMRFLSPLVRFTLIINYLTLLLGLQFCIGVWWKKATILAGLFATTYVAIYLVAAYIWPLTAEAFSWFVPPPTPSGFSPANPQGRTFRTDQRTQ